MSILSSLSTLEQAVILIRLRMQVLERHEDDMTWGQVTSRAGRQAHDNNIESTAMLTGSTQ